MQKRTINPEEIDFKEKFSLENKWIIITGACGLIGRAFCEAICQFGGNVIVADIEVAKPESYAKQLSKRFNRLMMGVVLDVSSKKSVLNLKWKC